MKIIRICASAIAMLMAMAIVYGDIPEHPHTEFIYVGGKKFKLEDGVDLSRKDLRNIEINYSCKILRNVKFDHSDLSGIVLREITLDNCSFRNTRIYYGNFSEYTGSANVTETCDFTDAVLNAVFFQAMGLSINSPGELNDKMGIRNPGNEDVHRYGPTLFPEEYFRPGVQNLRISKEQLVSTRSFKEKNLRGIGLVLGDFRGIDFSNFDLRGTSFGNCILQDCNFSNARVNHAGFSGIGFTWEQLCQTKDYKDGKLHGLYLNPTWPNCVIDFSGYDLSGTYFGHGHTLDQTWMKSRWYLQHFHTFVESLPPALPPGTGLSDQCKLNLKDSVITNCNFKDFQGITLENIKSTWNYKHGRMEGINLPPEIQKALDEEKNQ